MNCGSGILFGDLIVRAVINVANFQHLLSSIWSGFLRERLSLFNLQSE